MVLTRATLSFAGIAAATNQGHVKSGQVWHPVPTTPTGEELVGQGPLPDAFDWRNVNGKSFVTPNLNQHIPKYCGSCWIHGTVGALNDRIKILRGGEAPDVMLGRQVVLNCVEDDDGNRPGCEGGEAYMIFRHMRESPVPDETCNPYVAENQQCTPKNTCMNCFPATASGLPPNASVAQTPGSCFAVENFVGYSVGDSGTVSGELAIKKEIFARGPITCGMQVPNEFLYKFAESVKPNGGVWSSSDPTNTDAIDHDVSVTGWGETPEGLKYWLVRNSWGSYWGEAGWFKIRRGDNHLSIEYNCSWAVPEFDELDRAMSERVMGNYIAGLNYGVAEEKLAVFTSSDQQLSATGGFLAGAAVATSAAAALAISLRRSVSGQPLLG